MSVIVFAYRQVYACKSKGRYLDTEVNLMNSWTLLTNMEFDMEIG